VKGAHSATAEELKMGVQVAASFEVLVEQRQFEALFERQKGKQTILDEIISALPDGGQKRFDRGDSEFFIEINPLVGSAEI